MGTTQDDDQSPFRLEENCLVIPQRVSFKFTLLLDIKHKTDLFVFGKHRYLAAGNDILAEPYWLSGQIERGGVVTFISSPTTTPKKSQALASLSEISR